MFKITIPECDLSSGIERLTEKHVQALWFDYDMRPDAMTTTDGERVNVIDPGEWNLEAGPDFLGAVLEIGPERKRIRGDVEIHLRPSDWTVHRHGDDPAYRNVIAHVTWFPGLPPRSLPTGAVSITIGELVSSQTGFTPEHIDLTAYPFAKISREAPPCRDLVGSSPEHAEAVLMAAGRHRLNAKANRLECILKERPDERMQILYEEIMSALGYRHNSRAFRYIAKMIPLNVLQAEADNAEFALLCAAEFINWDRRSMRPNNSPERRLHAAAQFFSKNYISTLIEMKSFERADLVMAVAALTKDGFIGKRRAAAIVTNILVPMALAEGRLNEIPSWLPPEDLSSPMRLTAMRIFGRDHNPSAIYLRNGLKMQGLLQIHREFCLALYPECNLCSVAALGVA